MALAVVPEVMWGRRAFATAQALLGSLGAPAGRLPGLFDVGWHGTSIDPETGSFAVVQDGAGLDDLVGEILRVAAGRRTVYVYVLGSRPVPTQLSLSRRAFMGLALPTVESVPCIVEELK